MKRTAFAIAFALVMGLTAGNAAATPIAIGDANYLGKIESYSGNQAEEMWWISKLLDLSPGGVFTIPHPPDGPQNDEIGTASANNFSMLPDPTMGPKVGYSGTLPDLTINVAGYTYLFNKYGNDGHVWVVSGLTSVTFDTQIGQGGGLSHYSLYGPTSVPDGGMTLSLLGGALVGLGLLRRKLGA